MGDVVAFRPPARGACGPQSESAPCEVNVCAEILFFTGVRFARFEDYPERPKPSRNAQRRRARRRARR